MAEKKEVSLTELYGSMVFSDKVMHERLPKSTYNALKKAVSEGKGLDISVANTVAAAMKEWAIELGATHFTHWFQPMTGLTAEKHDSFISPTPDGGVLMDFSGKELVKGEPDASSFPSGGLRATFEARGYTAWDPSSPAFVKDHTLYIPTAFCSYGGEALDHKTPLLRSMEAVSNAAVKLLHLLGNTAVRRVDVTMGSEQEYFLIDKELYKQRKDLMFTGRTLFGAPSPKGQEMEDHYFGVLKPRIADFMHDLDLELWKLGVPAKTKHNEVAPAQHELAPLFETLNIAVDHNQLTMEMMKKVADRHGFACLLHEKPFEKVNGSGKHNNWSLLTDQGENLLDPGSTPAENTQFLVILMGVISAVDEYADLMRVSVATAGNDHRLGANEAPPAIVSVFIGDELENVLEAIENDDSAKTAGKTLMEIAHVLPTFVRDNTDRNRTSPFAFTGNKFEFRMPGSSLSVADPNITLNAAVAESFSRIYDALCDVPAEKLQTAIHSLIKDLIRKHKKVIFNGNGYTDDWIVEAEKRGLPNLKSVPDALPALISDKSFHLFAKQGVYSKEELESRYYIRLENYSKSIHIEAVTMSDMIKKSFTPAMFDYMKSIGDEAASKKALMSDVSITYETEIVKKLSAAADIIKDGLAKLDEDTKKAETVSDDLSSARFYHDVVLADMEKLRATVDEAEALIPNKYLPYPTYEDLLFSQL